MPNHIDSLEKIDKKLQQSSDMFDDPVSCYVEGIVNTKLQPLVKEKPKSKCVRQSKRIGEHAYENNEENEEGLETCERTLC